MRFLYFSLSSSALIGLVLLIRTLFRKKLAPGVIYALWLVPLIRLMIPFASWELPVFGTVADMMNVPHVIVSELQEWKELSEGTIVDSENIENIQIQQMQNETISGTKIYDAVSKNRGNIPEKKSNSVNEIPQEKSTQTEKSYEWILIGVWFVGAFFLGIYVFVQNRKLKISVAAMQVVDEVEGLQICVGNAAKVPCLVGVENPKIVIPEEIARDKELYRCVLQHELAHYHQKDYIWNAVKILMCVLYWWNPLVWFAAKCVEEDAELACDARVIKNQSVEVRKSYGYALLKILENAQNRSCHFYAATSMSGSKKSMKRRIQEISGSTTTKKQVALPVMLLLMVILILGCGIPTDKSWIKTAEWDSDFTEDMSYIEAEYSYALQDNIQSMLLYYEIYEYGELEVRKVLAFGETEDFGSSRDTMKLRRESVNVGDEDTLIVDFGSSKAEMEVPVPKYNQNANHNHVGVGNALNSDSGKIEIIPETAYVLMADYRAEEGAQIQPVACEQLSFYTEEELKEALQEDSNVALVRIVFSELSAKELYQNYVDSEVLEEEQQQGIAILKINNSLYYDTGETGPMGDSGAVGGHIQSTVDENEVPQENEESNFGCVGNPYTWDDGDGMIMVLMDDEEYHIFQRKGEMTPAVMATAWAEAFVYRNVTNIEALTSEEGFQKLIENGLVGEYEEGEYYFGWSSPWPMFGNQLYEVVECNDSSAKIRYYASFSTPHVYVWGETLEFENVNDEFQVVNESNHFYDAIDTVEEFYQAYPEGTLTGTMMDYYTNGLGEFLNENALENPEYPEYQALFDAGTAALELLNISKDEELVHYEVEDSGGIASVQIYFLREGGKSDVVEVTMWQPYEEEGIWIPQ